MKDLPRRVLAQDWRAIFGYNREEEGSSWPKCAAVIGHELMISIGGGVLKHTLRVEAASC